MADENKKIPHAYCFLDTNILIQFQTFNEVNWLKVLNAKQVCLVLAPVVIHELDIHKSDYSNARRQKRARMLLPKITKLIEEEPIGDELPQVRRNVTLMVLPNEPLIDWRAEHLDPMVNDDRLIASILEFSRQHPSENVLLLSDDSGPRFKAKSHNILAKDPPCELIRHIEPPSSEEIEIRELKEKLAVFTNRMPKLRLGFWENGEVVDEITRPLNEAWRWQTPVEYAEEKITWKREALEQMLARADNTVKEDEIQKFTQEYEKYLVDLEPALKMQFIREYSPRCKLELSVINEGTATAKGVDVHINFPIGSSIVFIDNLNNDIKIDVDMPKEPVIPEWAMSPVSVLAKNVLNPSFMSLTNAINSLASFNSMNYSLNLSPNFLSPNTYKNRYFFEIFPFHRNTVTERAEQIGHHRQIDIKPMIVYLVNVQFTVAPSLFRLS